MRVLLIAYEFPPSPSPQSLRWAYLVRELHAHGHDVHVLTANLGGDTPGLPHLPDGVHVHRTFPGLLRGALAMHREYRARHPHPAPGDTPRPRLPADAAKAPPAPPAPAALRPPRNWKQRISELVQEVVAWVRFPDIRGEWRYWGARRLRRLMQEIKPDVLVSSHEPATTLQLALGIAGNVPWIADLGDPVLAPYTPARWRGRSARIERDTCARANAITVTSEGTAALLLSRHGRSAGIHVLTQGFDLSPPQAGVSGLFDPSRLELLYTGSLYAFRRIDTLITTVVATPGVRLSIAAVTVPESIIAAARAHPMQIRLLGFLPHASTRALQREADVLVNLANLDPVQIPGKFYEYLGSMRPILHLCENPDAISARISELQRGWCCSQDAGALGAVLSRLAVAKAAGELEDGLVLDTASVAQNSWQQLGRQLDALLHEVVAGNATPRVVDQSAAAGT